MRILHYPGEPFSYDSAKLNSGYVLFHLLSQSRFTHLLLGEQTSTGQYPSGQGLYGLGPLSECAADSDIIALHSVQPRNVGRAQNICEIAKKQDKKIVLFSYGPVDTYDYSTGSSRSRDFERLRSMADKIIEFGSPQYGGHVIPLGADPVRFTPDSTKSPGFILYDSNHASLVECLARTCRKSIVDFSDTTFMYQHTRFRAISQCVLSIDISMSQGIAFEGERPYRRNGFLEHIDVLVHPPGQEHYRLNQALANGIPVIAQEGTSDLLTPFNSRLIPLVSGDREVLQAYFRVLSHFDPCAFDAREIRYHYALVGRSTKQMVKDIEEELLSVRRGP